MPSIEAGCLEIHYREAGPESGDPVVLLHGFPYDNPDFVEVVLHSYRHRLGVVPGDLAYESIEVRLAWQPDITVPSIVLQGRDDGVDPPEAEDSARPHFTGFYERRLIDGAGHNLPQEAPEAFAAAILRLAER